MSEQDSLNLQSSGGTNSVEKYKFEPIKGYPMLHWNGKRPFISTQYYPAQKKEVYGDEVNGWINKIFWGDNLQVMSHLLKKYRNTVNLIYIDPPYDSAADYKKKISVKGSSTSTSNSTFEEKQYSDIWNNDEYLQFMYERIILMRELLCDKGVLVLHCDWHKNHHLRCILDEVFGNKNFQNEIVWYYYNKMQGNINKFASNHDTILVYSKSEKFTFNKCQEKRESPVRQIKRVWSSETKSLVNAKDEDGKVVYIDSTHKTIDDVWRLSMLQPADKVEVMGYPTQKPESLVERIIYSFSNPGDIVMDIFCGAGTTASVAAKMGRRYIISDINLTAIRLSIKRLISISNDLKENKYPCIKNGLSDDQYLENPVNLVYNSFELYNVNNYELFKNPEEAKSILLEILEIEPLSNSIYDGEKDGYKVKVMPINRISTREDLNDLIANFPYKLFEQRKEQNPSQPVESVMLVCMGHEADLKANLEQECGYKLNVRVVDVLRDKSNIEFKRDSEALISISESEIEIVDFFPMNLLQKLSLQKESISEWRELVESIVIDWNFDGAAMEPSIIDIANENKFVTGKYPIPKDAGTIKIKITDLLSESFEEIVKHG